MSNRELFILAQTTRALNPKVIFEIGTYNGLTTAVFMLNSGPDTEVVSLDLPLVSDGDAAVLGADQHLIHTRQLGSVPRNLGLRGYTQLLSDSIFFDPTPYLGSVDLGLIDGAHDLAHVRNDTLKMLQMMSPRGMIFWHDYGGKSELGPLSLYLESLGKRCPLYRIPDTNLAWARSTELKKII